MEECPDLKTLRSYLTSGYAFNGNDADEIVAGLEERQRLLLQLSEARAKVDKCRCCGDPLVCPKRFEDMNRLIDDLKRRKEEEKANCWDQIKELRDLLGRFTALDCCDGYSLGRDEYPKLWDALNDARRILGTDLKRKCDCLAHDHDGPEICACCCMKVNATRQKHESELTPQYICPLCYHRRDSEEHKVCERERAARQDGE